MIQGAPEIQALGLIQAELREVRHTLSHLDFKVKEIGDAFTQTELKKSVAQLKPLILLLVIQGFIIIGLLAKIALA